MATSTETELVAHRTMEELQAQVAAISKRIELMEKRDAEAAAISAMPARTVAPAPVATNAIITEDELLAISAALGAYLGVRAHIRQIRLVGTSAWAQQGRVSIQASHQLQG